MKTAKKIGEKVAEKVKKAKGRIARKVGKSAKTAAALLAFCLILCGCSTTGQQPAKSQTQNNELHDCIVIVGATKLTMPKGVTARRRARRIRRMSTRRSTSRSTRATAERQRRHLARLKNCWALALTGFPAG